MAMIRRSFFGKVLASVAGAVGVMVGAARTAIGGDRKTRHAQSLPDADSPFVLYTERDLMEAFRLGIDFSRGIENLAQNFRNTKDAYLLDEIEALFQGYAGARDALLRQKLHPYRTASSISPDDGYGMMIHDTNGASYHFFWMQGATATHRVTDKDSWPEDLCLTNKMNAGVNQPPSTTA